MDRRRYVLIAWVVALLILGLAGFVAYIAMRPKPAAPPPPAPPPVTVAPPAQAPLQPQPAQAAAFPNLAGQVLADGCRQGGCHWSRVVRLERVRTVPEGDLLRLTARGGYSSYDQFAENVEAPERYSDAVRVTWDAADTVSYIFCSRARPAFAFPDEGGGFILHYLDLYDLAGYQLSSAHTYMRACHDAEYDGDNEALLRRLGYRPGTRNDQVEHGRPEDLARF